jgi:YihY family inner membrane protein
MDTKFTITKDPLPSHRTLSLWFRFWLFWKAAILRFNEKNGFIHASSLSYTTLVGLIPVLAVGLSVATSLMLKEGKEGQVQVEIWIDAMVRTVAPMLDLEVRKDSNEIPNQPSEGFLEDKVFDIEQFWEKPQLLDLDVTANEGDHRREVARRIAGFVGRIHTRTIGVTSVFVFLMIALLLLRAIERSFNQVWNISRNRNWGAGIAQYWAGLTLGPFLFIVGAGLSSTRKLQHFNTYILELGWLGECMLFLLAWVVTGSACALVYRVMTHTRVHFQAAAGGGMAAGFLLQLNSQLSVVYFSNVATANKIYGSLGAVPILLLGLYVSWIILIFGSHVAFIIQYPSSCHSRMDSLSGKDLSHSTMFSALRLMRTIAQRFQHGKTALTTEELANDLGLGLTEVLSLAEALVKDGLIVRSAGIPSTLTLAKPVDNINLFSVIYALEGQVEKVADSKDVCANALKKIVSGRDQTASKLCLSELVDMEPSSHSKLQSGS